MLVINTAGYHFGFMYKGTKIVVPFDYVPHPIPDDSPKFRELQPIVIVEENHSKESKESKESKVSNVVNIATDFFNDDDINTENEEFEESEDFKIVNQEKLVENKVPKKRIFSKIKKKKK